MSELVELLAAVALAVGAIYYVLRPVLRPYGAPATEPAASASDGDDPEDDLSPGAVALRALKEIEFDRATGKLSAADYEALRATYTARALEALREEPRGEMRDAGGVDADTHLASRIPHPACPACGPRPEVDAAFCSACGRRLGSAPGYCTRCGTALEAEARYCGRCGARVAA